GILRRTASDVGIRPLRRRWGNQESRGREGIAPHIPGGQPGQQQYPSGQGRGGGQQQPGRGPVPYSPGGRGQASGGRAPSPYDPAAEGPSQRGGRGPKGGAQPGQPYGPYNPYEPYPNAYPGTVAGEAPPQGGRRGRFSRYNEPRTGRGNPPPPNRGGR